MRAAARRTLGTYAELHHMPASSMVLLAAVGFTAVASGGPPPAGRLLPFLCAVLLTQLAIAYHNDYCDRDLDARTKPWRPIPSGRMPARLALALSVALAGLGLLASAFLGPAVVGLVALGTGAGFVYNWRLKRSALSWAPLWVALPTLAICAFEVAGRSGQGLGFAYVLGLPIALSIYLADALPDVESDGSQGVRSAAYRLGSRGARAVCWGSLALAMALALAFWPPGRPPGPLLGLSVVAFALSVALGWREPRRVHFVAVSASALLLALDWLLSVAASAR